MGKKNRKSGSIIFVFFTFVTKSVLTLIILTVFNINLFSEGKIPKVNPNEDIIHEDFNGDELAPEYEIWDGPGLYHLSNGILRYYPIKLYSKELPEPSEIPGDKNSVSIDYLGRPSVPSCLIAREFFGDSWILETKVKYNFKENSNDTRINLLISFGELAKFGNKFICIGRSQAGIDTMKDRFLCICIVEKGKLVEPINIISTDQQQLSDEYFFRIIRNRNNFKIFLSLNGIDYTLTKEYTFENAENEQEFIINGSSFSGGAFVDIDYLYVKSLNEIINTPMRHLPHVNKLYKKRGESPNKLEKIQASEIIDAIIGGKNVDIQFANIIGDLDITKIIKSDSSTSNIHVTFKGCVFDGPLIGNNLSIKENFLFFWCYFRNVVGFSGSKFYNRVNFSHCVFLNDTRFIETNFKESANFTGSRFENYISFRRAIFDNTTSFYGANFKFGADFSSVLFSKNVSFSDFGFSESAEKDNMKPTMAFNNSYFHGETFFILTLQRQWKPPSLGDEMNFEHTYIEKFNLSTGDPDVFSVPNEQTGKGKWDITCNMIFRNARIKTFIIKNINFKGTLDLQGVSFEGPSDSVRFINADFINLKIDSWPLGKVVSSKETSRLLVTGLEESKNAALGRIVYFDVYAISKYYDKWINERENIFKKNWLDKNELLQKKWNTEKAQWDNDESKWRKANEKMIEDMWLRDKISWIGAKIEDKELAKEEKKTYRDYFGFKLTQFFLGLFFLISGYGTSVIRVFMTGIISTFLFTAIFFISYRKRKYFTMIKKELVLKFRLGETPIISDEDKIMELSEEHREKPKNFLVKIILLNLSYLETIAFVFIFFVNVLMKIGFGDIRLKKNAPKRLRNIAWTAWVFGYIWYVLLIYTLVVIPILKGLV